MRTYLFLIFCVVVWGSNFIFGKILVQEFSPSLLTSLRLLFIVLALTGVAIGKRELQRVNRRDILAIILLGIIGIFINQWTFFIGLQTADTTTSALILATTPILTGFLAAIFLKEKLTPRMLIGSIIAIMGIYFVVTKGNLASIEVERGLLWIVATMVSFSFMIMMTRVMSQRLDPLTITLYSNIVGFVVSIPFVFMLDKPLQISSNMSYWTLLIVSAIIVHGFANLIWNHNIRYVDASRASILSNLEPFVAMVVGFVLLAKPITTPEIVGSIFIVGGVVFSTYQRNRRMNRTISNK